MPFAKLVSITGTFWAWSGKIKALQRRIIERSAPRPRAQQRPNSRTHAILRIHRVCHAAAPEDGRTPKFGDPTCSFITHPFCPMLVEAIYANLFKPPNTMKMPDNAQRQR